MENDKEKKETVWEFKIKGECFLSQKYMLGTGFYTPITLRVKTDSVEDAWKIVEGALQRLIDDQLNFKT